MKLASYMHAEVAGFGAVIGSGIVDLGRRLGSRYPDLRSMLGAAGQAEARAAIAGAAPDFQLAQVQLLPVIPNPDKIICVGLNY